MKARRWWLLAIGGIALALLAGRALSGAYTDYRWYEAMDALALWRARFVTVTALRLASGAVATAFIFANLWAVRRTVVSLRLPRRLGNIEIAEEVPSRYLLAVAAAIALLFGALVTLPAETWTTFFLSNIGLPFNEPDPHFQSDLGFFVYWLPVERELYYWSVIAALLVTVLVIFLYALTPSLRWERGRLHISNYVRRHLVVLCAVLMVTLAWNHRLDAFEVLLSGSGENGTLTAADLDGRIPINLALSLVTLVAAVLVVIFGWTGQVRSAFIGIATILLLSLVLDRALPPLIGRGDPDAAERAQAYAATRTLYTRRAYGLELVRNAEPAMLISSRREAARSTSIWDEPALARWMSRSRESEGIAHAIGMTAAPTGVLATIINAPATTASDSLTSGRWTLARVLASTTDRRGDPLRLRPTRSPGRDSDAIPAPVVYDGATGYAVVGDTAGTLAAPALNTTLSRLTHAWSLQNFRLLVSDPRPTPRIVRRRGVRERVRAVAPFFVQGRRVAPIASDGQLLWALDLYAASANYPVSQHVTLGDEEFSYVRHAATALVDAYSGRVTLLADSALDPIGRSWVRRFPSLFSDWSQVPPRIAAAIPPALDAGLLHALILARHGRRGEAPPRGQLPADEGADSGLVAPSAPSVVMPISEDAAAWTVPVLDQSGSMRGVVIATGGHTRGTYWLSAGRAASRWNDVVDRVRRSRESDPARPNDPPLRGGRVRVIPMSDRLAFTQSAYAWPAEGPPALVRVTVLDQDSVYIGRSVAEAFGIATVSTPDPGEPITDESLRAQATRLYDVMRDALARGDWAAFGEAYEALGALLSRPPR